MEVVAGDGSIVGEIEDIPGAGRMVTCKDTEDNVSGQKESEQNVELGELSRVWNALTPGAEWRATAVRRTDEIGPVLPGCACCEDSGAH